MNLSLILKSYVQHLLRRGKFFHQILQDLEETEKLSFEELITYQNQKLRGVVAQAYKNVPYYKKLFDKLHITPEAIKSVADLKLLPILEKEDIRGHEKEFKSQAVKFSFKASTSGTTGKPLKLYRDLFSINLENATLWRQKRWSGLGFDERRAALQGQIVTPIDINKPPFWQYIPSSKKLLMSSYHLSDQLIPYYLDSLREFKPSTIEAYPSSVYLLARYMEIHQEEPIPVKAVFTSSEMLFEHQRKVIEQYFGTVFDFYGDSERVAYIAMCEFGNYHYAMDYSIVEFIPTEETGLYQIVGTNLHNAAMPLLRYNTGDLARLSHQNCPCGRAFPLIESIEGRQDDYIITPSGKRIARLGRAFKNVSHVIESQIIQEEIDSVRVLIVPSKDFTQNDEEILLNNLQERLSLEIKIVIEKVEAIPRTKQGKYRLVISKVQS